MNLGPTSVLVIEFQGGEYKGEILAALVDLVQKGTVRVVDAIAVKKDGEGKITALEINQLPLKDVHVFDPLQAEVTGLLSNTDIQKIGAMLDKNSAAGLLAIEHLWAENLAQAIVRAKGKVVMNQLMMPEDVEENLKLMEAVGK